MADIRDLEHQQDGYWTGLGGKTGGHDVASLNAHNQGNKPTRKWVGVEAEIATHVRGGGKITDWKDGRYYFSGAFGSVTFTKGQVGEDFLSAVVFPNLKG